MYLALASMMRYGVLFKSPRRNHHRSRQTDDGGATNTGRSILQLRAASREPRPQERNSLAFRRGDKTKSQGSEVHTDCFSVMMVAMARTSALSVFTHEPKARESSGLRGYEL